MKLLFKIIVGFLATIGAITIAAVAYLYFVDPFGLKPLLMGNSTPIPVSATNANTPANPLLTPQQAAAIKKLGIDPAKLPTTITPALETCFTNALGANRVREIKSGSSPTPLDLFKVKSCLQ